MMKKWKVFCFIGIISLLLAGCGKGSNGAKLEEGWNGLYKTDSDYYIMLYTDDNKNMTFNVILHDGSMTMYPIQYGSSVTIQDENTLTYEQTTELFDESSTAKLHVTKKGNTITVKASDTDKNGILNDINGTYTKYANVSSGDVEEFKAP